MSFKVYTFFFAIVSSLCANYCTAQDSSRFSILVNPIVIANVGRSYGVNAQYELSSKWAVYAGLKYHQNFIMQPKFNNQRFRYRFRANTGLQHLGYSAGACYKIKWPYSALEPYVYYDVTYFNMDLRTIILTDADTIINGVTIKGKLATPIKYYDLHSLENNIGLGLACNLTKWLSINTRGGIGGNFIFNLPAATYPNRRHIDLSLQYVFGFQLHF